MHCEACPLDVSLLTMRGLKDWTCRHVIATLVLLSGIGSMQCLVQDSTPLQHTYGSNSRVLLAANSHFQGYMHQQALTVLCLLPLHERSASS